MPAMSTNTEGGGAQRATSADTGRSGAPVTAKKAATSSAKTTSTPPRVIMAVLTGFSERRDVAGDIETDCVGIANPGCPLSGLRGRAREGTWGCCVRQVWPQRQRSREHYSGI